MKLPDFKKPKKGNLPNLIIIGAQKCGTTSLHYNLGLHPEIFMSKEKELNFFVGRRNWNRGIEWYKSNFAGIARIYGESSPSYTVYPFLSGVPERIYSLVPEAKLIYILRDPIDRIISHYLHNYSIGREEPEIEAALSPLDNNPYIFTSKYFMQLGQYLNYFPKSNILIITLEDLYSHCRLTLQKVFEFLNVDETFYSPKFLNIKHKSSEKRKKNRIGLFLKWLAETNTAKIFSTDIRMKVGRVLYVPFSTKIEAPILDESLRKKLIDHLKDDIDHLREYTGCNFKEWSV